MVSEAVFLGDEGVHTLDPVGRELYHLTTLPTDDVFVVLMLRTRLVTLEPLAEIMLVNQTRP